MRAGRRGPSTVPHTGAWTKASSARVNESHGWRELLRPSERGCSCWESCCCYGAEIPVPVSPSLLRVVMLRLLSLGASEVVFFWRLVIIVGRAVVLVITSTLEERPRQERRGRDAKK